MRSSWKVIEYGSEFPLEMRRGAPVVDGDGFVYTRSGRDALRLAASTLKEEGCEIALLPCYCCGSMATPFTDAGLEIRYYGVDEKLHLDLDSIAKVATPGIREAFLYMNYYGVHSVTKRELRLIKEELDLAVIKDATHDWLDYGIDSESNLDDFTVVSLRKWAGLPDGGLVYAGDRRLASPVANDGAYAEARKDAMGQKGAYLESGEKHLKGQYLKKLRDCGELLESFHEASSMSAGSRSIAGGVDWKNMAAVRRRNAAVLHCGLEELGVRHFYSEETTPLWIPFVPECDRDRLQATLAKQDLYCPYLWPLPKGAYGCSDAIDRFVDSMLCLPCDQRYDEDDMGSILGILERGLMEMGK